MVGPYSASRSAIVTRNVDILVNILTKGLSNINEELAHSTLTQKQTSGTVAFKVPRMQNASDEASSTLVFLEKQLTWSLAPMAESNRSMLKVSLPLAHPAAQSAAHIKSKLPKLLHVNGAGNGTLKPNDVILELATHGGAHRPWVITLSVSAPTTYFSNNAQRKKLTDSIKKALSNTTMQGVKITR